MTALAHAIKHDYAVRLTEAERRICVWVGEQRYRHASGNARDPGAGPSRERRGPHFDVRGACCEYAASLMLNLSWRPTVGQIDQRDVGGIVDVRSTDLANGRLIIKPDGTGPYMLVVQVDDYEYWSPGWIDAGEAKTRYPLLTSHGDPAHFVPQNDLRSIDELCATIALDDAIRAHAGTCRWR